MHIQETVNKLRQLGARVRLRGNDADKRRILQKHCDLLRIHPVYAENGEVLF